jgi:hypothetical protein
MNLIAAALVATGAVSGFSDPRTIDNPYLPLSKYTRCELRGRADDGTRERNVVRRLRRSRAFTVNGQRVPTVVMDDRAFEDGELVERTFDYFAQSDDGTVHYFGEHVDNLRRGRIVDHHGSWLFGRDTRVLGVAMPPRPTLGMQWRLEDVPRITVESDRVEELGLRARAAGRLHHDVIRVQEFTQPEGEVEYKLYAPGVGVITEYAPEGRSVLKRCR